MSKRDYDYAVKKSVSMPEVLFDMASDEARRRGYTTFSDYIQSLLRDALMPKQNETNRPS